MGKKIGPVKNSGALSHLLAEVLNITDQTWINAALRESEERFRLLADKLLAFFWTAQPDGVVDYLNKSYLEYLGRTSDGSSTTMERWPVHHEDLPETIQNWQKALETGEPCEMIHRLRCFDGSYRWHLCRTAPVRNERDEIIKWYAEAVDIHEIREAWRDLERRIEGITEELRQKDENLREANTTIKVLLNLREEDKKDFSESVSMNVKNLIGPYIERFKQTEKLSSRQLILLETIESHLKEIASPFSKTLALRNIGFTSTEMMIAALIRNGKSTAEIADVLCISEKTVSHHRDNIREKLGLRGSKNSLRSYLLSLS